MFLDDELEAIYQENGDSDMTSAKLLKACIMRVRPLSECRNGEEFLNNIKRSDLIGRAWVRIYPFSEMGAVNK